MSANWHYSKGGERHGPITEEQLRELAASGQLQASDLVWQQGMKEWAKAETVGGLFPTSAPRPVVPKKPPPPPPLRQDASAGETAQTQASGITDWIKSDQAKQVTSHPAFKPVVIVISYLTFCLTPLALILIWTSGWTTKQKWAWTAPMLFWVFVSLIVANSEAPPDEGGGASTSSAQLASDGSGNVGGHSRAVETSGVNQTENVPKVGGGVEGRTPFPEEGEDPSVSFEDLDFDSIDFDKGPQGQPVRLERTMAGYFYERKYEGKDGKWYKHGEQKILRPEGTIEEQKSFVFGRPHGYFFKNVSPSGGPIDVAIETVYFNGDKRKAINWLDYSRKRKHSEEEFLNGKKHGWELFWDENGVQVSKVRYEHGKVVETSFR